MSKFDSIIEEAFSDDDYQWTPPQSEWDSTAYEWTLYVGDGRGMSSTAYIGNVRVKNTTEGLKIYNALAKYNNWPILTKKKFIRDTWFTGAFAGYKYSAERIHIVIGVPSN